LSNILKALLLMTKDLLWWWWWSLNLQIWDS